MVEEAVIFLGADIVADTGQEVMVALHRTNIRGLYRARYGPSRYGSSTLAGLCYTIECTTKTRRYRERPITSVPRNFDRGHAAACCILFLQFPTHFLWHAPKYCIVICEYEHPVSADPTLWMGKKRFRANVCCLLPSPISQTDAASLKVP